MASRATRINDNLSINHRSVQNEVYAIQNRRPVHWTPPITAAEANINSDFATDDKESYSSAEHNRCCCVSNNKRQRFCLNLLYYEAYTLCYYLIILITIAAMIYDLWGDFTLDNSTLSDRPYWYIALNMTCVGLMVFDILIHIQAFKCVFFESIMNWIDFLFVVVCAAASPIYWFVPAWILLLLLFLRFSVRLLRRHTFRKQYVSARNIMVDFSAYEETNDEEQERYHNIDGNDAVDVT